MEARQPPAHRRSRRELAVAGVAVIAGAAGAVIATSGGGPKRPPRAARAHPAPLATAAELDIVTLGGLLRFERHCAAVYSLATAALHGTALDVAVTLLEHEREHARAVAGAIHDLGGTPAPAADFAEWAIATTLARGRGPALGVLERLEQQSVGAYLDAVEQISTEDVRVTVAAILGAEAEHLALVRGEAGRPQLGPPFVVGTGGAEGA
jgi:hypothetical protein